MVHAANPIDGAGMQTQIHETFAALGEPNRLAVVLLLRDEPRRPADIATALFMSRPAISRHLRVLRKSGLVEEKTLEADARGRVYQLRREAFSDPGREARRAR